MSNTTIPKIHARVEVEQYFGDHGRVVEVPLTVADDMTLRELIDLAGEAQTGRWIGHGYESEPWRKLRATDRIMISVEEVSDE